MTGCFGKQDRCVGVISHPSRFLGDGCTRTCANIRVLVGCFSATMSLNLRDWWSTLLSFSRSVRPYGPDRSERIAPALGQRWFVRSGLVRCDGRGFAVTSTRPVHTGGRRSAIWPVCPSGRLDHDVESNLSRFRIETDPSWLDRYCPRAVVVSPRRSC